MLNFLTFLGSADFISLAKKIIYLTLISLFYGIMISVYLFALGAFITSFNLLNEVLAFIEAYNSTGGASGNTTSLGVFFQLLSCLGIIDAFNASKVMLFSSISFLFLRYLHNLVLSTYAWYLRLVTPLITK